MKEVPEVSAELEATIRADERKKNAHGALWDAINAYSQACGGHPTGGGVPRMNAVVQVERALAALFSAAASRDVSCSECGESFAGYGPDWCSQHMTGHTNTVLEQAAVEASEARSFDDCVLSAIVGGRTRAADIGVCVAAFLSRRVDPREIDRALQRLRRAGRIRFTSAYGWRPVPADKDSQGGGA